MNNPELAIKVQQIKEQLEEVSRDISVWQSHLDRAELEREALTNELTSIEESLRSENYPFKEKA